MLVHREVMHTKYRSLLVWVFYVLLDISITTEIESTLAEQETILVSGHSLGRLTRKDFEEIKPVE